MRSIPTQNARPECGACVRSCARTHQSLNNSILTHLVSAHNTHVLYSHAFLMREQKESISNFTDDLAEIHTRAFTRTRSSSSAYLSVPFSPVNPATPSETSRNACKLSSGTQARLRVHRRIIDSARVRICNRPEILCHPYAHTQAHAQCPPLAVVSAARNRTCAISNGRSCIEL